MNQTAKKHHLQVGKMLIISADTIHFIGWELAFAFDRMNVSRVRRGKQQLTMEDVARRARCCTATVRKLFRNGHKRAPLTSTLCNVAMAMGYEVGIRRKR